MRGLRDYGTASWDGGDPECEHKVRQDPKTYQSTLSGGKGTTGHQQEGFRAVCPRCGARRVDRQIGLEESPDAWCARLVEVFREVRRVLKDSGTLWLNVGDSWASGKGTCYNPGGGARSLGQERKAAGVHPLDRGNKSTLAASGLKPKDLIGLPWLLAFALRADGWWLRSDIIWHKCLSGGTLVYAKTQKGEMPMTVKDMARLDPATVQLWNGERWTQLVSMDSHARNGEELEIVLRSGERISCTPEHRFPTERGLLEARELVAGDVLQTCVLPEPAKPKTCVLDEDAAWFAGLYIAEGCRSGDTIQIAGHVKESARWERLQRVAAKYGGHITKTENGNTQNVRLYGKILNAVIDELVTGRVAINKAFAPVVWRYSNSFLDALLQGYLDGDGHYDAKNNRWRLGFCRNYNLERDLRTVCARLGYDLNLRMSSVPYDGRLVPTFRGEIRKTRNGHWNECSRSQVMDVRKARMRRVWDIAVADEPHLFALASGVLTHNSNPMPESVTDRPTSAHEHVFLLTKAARYYYDAEAVKERKASSTLGDARGNGNGHRRERGYPGAASNGGTNLGGPDGGRNLRNVWTINSQPFPESHFATYPEALVRRCILAGTSAKGVCQDCGKPWERVVERGFTAHDGDTESAYPTGTTANRLATLRQAARENGGEYVNNTRTLGWRPTCACGADVEPAVVLDPFLGSGTTLVVAAKLGRRGIGIELNPAYVAMAERRIAAAAAQPVLDIAL